MELRVSTEFMDRIEARRIARYQRGDLKRIPSASEVIRELAEKALAEEEKAQG